MLTVSPQKPNPNPTPNPTPTPTPNPNPDQVNPQKRPSAKDVLSRVQGMLGGAAAV